jgi:threonine dehydratase
VVSPFEDPAVVAGNGGSLALEVLEQLRGVGTFVVPCGGGGCVGGIGEVVRQGDVNARVYGVNTDASPGMWRSFRDGRAHLRVPDADPTIADGLEGGVRVSSYELCRGVLDDMVLAREQTIHRSVVDLASHDRVIVEGSAAAGVAALVDGAVPHPAGPICVVLTGGNIDRGRLARLLAGSG